MRKLRVALLTVCLGLVFAASVQAQSGSGVNDAELNGDYAFMFNGMMGGPSSANFLAGAGRFTANGAGALTNGELDINGVGAGSAAQAFTGSYSISADHRGVMTFNIAGSMTNLAFVMMGNGNAKFIEFDAAGGTGTIGSGTIEKADATAYSTARIAGDYAFGVAGQDDTNRRAGIAGRFTSNGAGSLSNAAGDVNAYGSVSSLTFTSASYSVSETITGRGTMNLAFQFAGGSASLNLVFYVVNAGKLFVMERDPVTAATPLVTGIVEQQQIPPGGFSNASLNGNIVIYLTGLSICANITGMVPKATAGLFTADGIGALSLTFDENFCRAANSVSNTQGTYSVTSNGRTSVTLIGDGVIGYLTDVNQGFLFSTDTSVLSGFGEAQAASALTNSAVAGTYAGVATDPVGFGTTVFSGEFSGDGASPTGNLTGTVDIDDASGPVSGASFAATYSISSSPTNGRGSITITSPSGGSAVAYVVSPTKFVAVPMNDPNPALWVFEQAPAVAVSTLSSLTLSPTSVTGGVQSSTGTVTLTGPAPSGGAQVALSSSNSGAAQVPSSVTVAAGATSATFTVTTSAVTAPTTVAISASYAGATKTASLTVNAVPPPPVSLSSLTLSPTSVTGGAQSSTGTVTLSGPAPSGGAQVALSSSNTSAARAPSTVTVAAGATSATFTVSTSAVIAPATVTISASYGGTTKTASLAVKPVPLPTVSSLTLNPASVTGGVQSSTGTVTLTGPAPSGGARIALSSSNSAARVPSSVVVPGGATSVTFQVNTSFVLISTSATISASYNNSARAANLSISF